MKQTNFLKRLLAKSEKRPKSIFLYLFAFVLLLTSQNVLAQERVISGKVVDETNSPLPGVTILLKGTDNGAATDFDGFFQLSAPKDGILVFSYLGYVTQEIMVGSKSTIDVSMVSDLNSLEEVVVIGYGTMRRRDVTGAVSSIKGSELEKADPTSFQNALAGRIAGVHVTQTDNGPGAGVKILIRGGSSLTSGNQPLFVIDGFPIVPDDSDPSSNPIADISPTQIESMEVLKDASATAIYGAQGANGVVIITTKKGKEGHPQINVGASYGSSQMVNVPELYRPYEYRDWIISVNEVEQYFHSNSEMLYDKWTEIKERGDEGLFWIDEITRLANTWNANVNFMGGASGMRYAVSGDYLSQEGIIINSKFDRLNLNANLEQKIGDRIKIGSTLRIATSQNEGMVNSWSEGAITKIALQQNPFVSPDLDINEDQADDDPTAEHNNENILNYIEDVDMQFETSRLLGNIFLEYKIIDGLKFYTSYGFNKYSKDNHEFSPSSTRAGKAPNGKARWQKLKTNSNVFQARFNYNKKFGEHSINAIAGFEAKTNDRTNFKSEVTNIIDQSRGIYDVSSAQNSVIPTNDYIEGSMASYLGRVNYNFKGKYLMTASLRADGSSKFGAENKWGYFPSVAAGWVASEEAFVKDLNTFDLLKLRMSYGKTGNDQIPSYRSLASLSTEKYIFDDVLYSGMVPNSVANPDLKWETTTQYNLGMDLGFFKNRLLFTAEAYYKETTDLLLDVQLPQTSGYEKAVQNVGSIENKGLEFTINSVNIEKNDFTWTTNFTLSYNRSKVLDLGDKKEMSFTRKFLGTVSNDVLLRVGEPIGIYYGFIEDQVLNSQTEIANSPNQNAILENEVGGHKLYDVNGDGIINTMDMVPLARTAPKYTGGLGNDLRYKNWDLSIFMRWVVGNDLINGNVSYMDRVGDGAYNTLVAMGENRFSPLNTDGTFHGKITNTYKNHMRSMYVEDGSFLKCDYITLGYKVPPSVLSKAKIRNLRLYARVTNPFMITRYTGFDPEVSTGTGTVAKVGPGADVGTYPRSVTYTFGLTLGL